MIELHGVSHVYKRFPDRAVRAVDDFSLTVSAGEILGIAGPNGAGKTTLISMLLGYLAPTSGTVRIAGLPPRTYVEHHGVGYLPELVVMNREWRLQEALRRFSLLEGMPRDRFEQRLEAVITEFGLEEHRKKLIKELSKGTLQRVGLAQATLAEHAVVIFDEPTHGLDPVWTHRFRDLVETFRSPARAILIASHNLDELQRLADRVVLIDRGRLQRIVDLRAVAGDPRSHYRLQLTGSGDGVLDVFAGAQPLGDNAFMLPAMDVATLNAGLVRLITGGALVTGVEASHTTLEQHFREAIKD